MNAWILLIAQYGLPFAYELWSTWRTKENPTEADWQAIKALANKTYDEYIAEAQARARAAGVLPPP